MSDPVDRAAMALMDKMSTDGHEVNYTQCREYAALAIAAAGPLAKHPHLEVDGDWLIEVVNYHTCGAGPGSGAGHEPGCGTIPVGRLATPEREGGAS